jgi:hypothetical protein
MRIAKNIAYTASAMSGGQQKASAIATGSSTATGTTVQATGSSQPKNNSPTSTQQQGISSANQPQTSASSSGNSASIRWILFGVQGSRLSMELEHIEIDNYVNDSHFYRSLRGHYRKHRGQLKLWFSVWRLGFCDGVKV